MEKKAKETLVIALGGNAIARESEKGSFEEQYFHVKHTAEELYKIWDQGYKIVVTHGNGPQAGNLLIQQESGSAEVPAQNLHCVGGMTQGQIGYMFQNTLQNQFALHAKHQPVATVVTQVLVKVDDPDFKDPTKPVGPFYTEEHAHKLATERKYIVKKVKPHGDRCWRRVVPSPEPWQIIEAEAIKALIDAGVMVICTGGGGIPVVKTPKGLEGVDAVIDKDKAGNILAQTVKADILLILTDIEQAMINYRKPNQRLVGTVTVAEAEKLLAEGHFLAGSMGPKILAAVRFVKSGGNRAIVTSLNKAFDGLKGTAGTIIMPNPEVSLKGRSFLKEQDFNFLEFRYYLDLAQKLKAEKKASHEKPLLEGKNIALLFEKDSTRTRCAFEAACHDQGAHCTYLGPSGSQMGTKETIEDTARVLSRMYDGIEYRGFSQSIVETLAKYSRVPVWNGLTDQFHPTQTLADFLTMMEHCPTKKLHQIKFVFMGDTRNNVACSLLAGGALMGMDVRLCGPKSLHPDCKLVSECQELAIMSKGMITITDNVDLALYGVDFVYTDVWVSMGEPAEKWAERMEMLKPYIVTMELLRKSANPEVKFMHCLPSFHNKDTKVGKKIFDGYGMDGIEVSEEVFESKHSIVFDQAENRLHTIKAVMVASIGEGK